MMDSPTSYIRASKEPCVHRARWVMVTPDTILEDACIETAQGRIQRVFPRGASPVPGMVDHGDGLLMPPLVNAHTHLELSALKGAVPFESGFQAWVGALLAKREALGEDGLIPAAEAAAREMAAQGPVGEISTLGITRDIMARRGVAGVYFREFLGSSPFPCQLEKGDFFWASLAGHAPHTTQPEGLQQLKSATAKKGLPFSIHVAESRVETEFIAGKKNQWYDFLVSRGIDPGDWPLGNKTPTAYLNDLGILGPSTLAVHLLELFAGDLELLARTGTRICLCPRSNMNLHGRLPDIPAMVEKGLAPALGTDSLASCDSLNMMDEMAFIRRHFPNLDPRVLLEMVGRNGAAALGMGSEFGALVPGMRSEFLYVNTRATSPASLIESVTANELR